MGRRHNKSSTNTPPNSDPNFKLAQEENLYGTGLKVHLANTLRLMQDNQRILNTSTAEDRALRQQRHQFREGQMAKMQGQNGIQFPSPEEEMGDINIESPTTTHNHYQPPAQSSMLPWVLSAALAAGAGGYGLSQLNKPATPTIPAPVNTNVRSGFNIELVPPEPSKPGAK